MMELERATELDRVMLRLQEWESLKGMNKVSKPARLEKLEEMTKVMTNKRYRVDVTGLELYLLHYSRMDFYYGFGVKGRLVATVMNFSSAGFGNDEYEGDAVGNFR